MTRPDVVVIGGGPAGLAAALVLARACRSVVVLDARAPRNAASDAIHGVIGAEGVTPEAFRAAAQAELARFDRVAFVDGTATELARAERGVRVSLADGRALEARRALLATGLLDRVPALPGARERWGEAVFACPHCHGFERRGGRWGLVAPKLDAPRGALVYRSWAESVVLFTHGAREPVTLPPALARAGLEVEARKPVALHGARGDETLQVELEDGARVSLRALVWHPKERQSDLVLFAGLALDAEGRLRLDADLQTSLPRVHAAGDAARTDAKVALALADGTRAAMTLVSLLAEEDVSSP